MQFDQQDIDNMSQHFRVHFINSLSGFKSANLIGTQDLSGQTNLSIVSSVFHLGADPALMGMIIRPHSTPRHTLENILDTGYFTINQVATSFAKQAHQTSARYAKTQSEFVETGLTPQYIGDFLAPYVQQSSLKVGMKLVEHQELAVNNTVLVIGEIINVSIDEKALAEDGSIDLEQLDTAAISGLDGYYQAKKLFRLSYAKPFKAPKEISD